MVKKNNININKYTIILFELRKTINLLNCTLLHAPPVWARYIHKLLNYSNVLFKM